VTEESLVGGRTTVGVVRVGATVRRPRTPNSAFVERLLAALEQAGFDRAPRYLGVDDSGRDILEFIEGFVPPELDAGYPDSVLAAAATLIRRFHDATAASSLAGGAEVVCHGDLSPCNFVFRDDEPFAIIDFDSASPGGRFADLGYALFLWLNLGTDGPGVAEQARRFRVFCDAYGVETNARVIDATVAAVSRTTGRLRGKGQSGADWWQTQLEWLERQRERLLER
jgi:tRNA A-37 threonylcarbamoyl transferase component Bud32